MEWKLLGLELTVLWRVELQDAAADWDDVFDLHDLGFYWGEK